MLDFFNEMTESVLDAIVVAGIGSETAGWLFLAGGWTMAGVLVILLITVRMRNRAEGKAREAQKELEKNYADLEKAYAEVSYTHKKMEEQYQQLKNVEERNRKLAYGDYLTDLPNRVSFMEKIGEVMQSVHPDEAIGIFFIDLDSFKNVNDTLGHSYGDEMLIDVTDRLKQALDEGDYLARFGGDEFIILTQNVKDSGELEEKAKRIQNVFSYPFVLAAREFFITVSIGIVVAPKDGKNSQVLLKNADSAMYAAKKMGKNTYCFYDETINEALMDKMELQSELYAALEKKEFEVYYQAQIDVEKQVIAGFEALIRWNHPQQGLLLPCSFIGVAEETGLIVPIGAFVLEESISQLKKWHDMGYSDVTMAVNLSARQFNDPELVHMVILLLEKYQMEPSSLELEITETIAMSDLENTMSMIEQFKEAGIHISLDDFGTGYSSMNYLKHLPVDHVKIDKSFMDTALDSERDEKIVSTIISLAKTLDMEVIAEGVENKKQAVFLKKAKCNRIQGFLYSKPIPAKDAEKLLKNFEEKKDELDLHLNDVVTEVEEDKWEN